jgi:hypothetical protein
MVLLSGFTQGSLIFLFILLLSIPFFVVGIITFIIFIFRKVFDITEPISYLKLYFTILSILVIFIVILITFFLLITYLRTELQTS